MIADPKYLVPFEVMQPEPLPTVSNTLLSTFRDWLNGKEQEEKPQSYRIGNLFDAIITQPEKIDLFNRKYTNFEEVFTFTESEYATLKAMRKSFEFWTKQSMWQGIISQCKCQVRCIAPYSVTPEIQFNLKSIYDLAIPGKVGIDLKTTKARTMKAFIAACEYFDYDRGRYLYMQSSGIQRDFVIGICTLPPYPVFVIDSVKQGWMETGKRKMDELLVEYYYYFC